MVIPRAVVLTVCIVLCGACGVSKSGYKEVKDKLAACETERDGYAAQRSELAKKLEDADTKLEAERESFHEKLDASKEELGALRKQRAELDKQLAEFQSLTDKFQEMIAADDIQVYVRRGRMIVSLPSSVLFDSGSAELSPRGLTTLEKVAGNLKEFSDRRFIVAGHTDNVPITTAGFEDNWQLSTTRALRVTRFLIEKGLDPKNLAAAGYGEHDPVRSNKTLAGRRLNRRIELVIEPNIPDFAELAKAADKAQKRAEGAAKKSGK